MEILGSNFLIIKEHFLSLSHNFRVFISTLGQALAIDEKLLLITGNSGDIRKIINKPDKIRLWFFQIVCLLANKEKEQLF